MNLVAKENSSSSSEHKLTLGLYKDLLAVVNTTGSRRNLYESTTDLCSNNPGNCSLPTPRCSPKNHARNFPLLDQSTKHTIPTNQFLTINIVKISGTHFLSKRHRFL